MENELLCPQAQVTTIALLGCPSATRLAQILDAAVTRLGLTEIVVIADSEMDGLACQWNRRRYQLTRYYPPKPLPLVGVALIFGTGTAQADRVIIIDGPAGSEGEDK